MIRVQVRVTKNVFNLLAPNLDRELQAETKDIAEEIAQDARDRAPVDTGHLQGDSINVEPITGTNGQLIIVSTEDETHEEYAIYPEFGTVNSPPQPYFTPAVEDARAKYPGRVGNVVRRRLTSI